MTDLLDLSRVKPGFDDPVLDSQACFRKVLDALSRPGRVATLEAPESPAPLNYASAGLALTLIDYDTPVFLSPKLRGDDVTAWLRFHCSSPVTETPEEARFAILAEDDTWPSFDQFHPGEAKYPDLSATLIVQVASLDGGPEITLQGPGIETSETISPAFLPSSFWSERADNVADFPLGVDCFLTAQSQLIGLPRTTRTLTA